MVFRMRIFMKKYLSEVITYAVIFTVTAVLCIFEPFMALNNILDDAVYQKPGVVNTDIKIIKIDEKTMDEYGPTTEWNRNIPSKLVEVLKSTPGYEPAVIVFDIMYSGKKDEASDLDFAKACEEAGNVIVAANVVYTTAVERGADGSSHVNKRHIDQVERPFAELSDATTYGFANTVQDNDGYIREAQLFINDNGEQVDSLAYAAYKAYKEKMGEPAKLPVLDSQNQTQFTFSGKAGAYEAISLCDVLDGKIDPKIFKDCIVMVGAYAPGLQDAFNVAIQRGSQMYGVEIHANILEALLEGRFAMPANTVLVGLIMAALAMLFYFLIRKRNIIVSIIALVVSIAAEIGIGLLLHSKGITISLMYLPIVLICIFVYKVFSQYVIEKIRRKKTMTAFKKYVAPQIVEELSRKNDLDIKLGGENRDVAVLFVDIRGFTTMSESLEPEQVVEILNEYLSLTTKSIFDNLGTLDKFVGDATMAVFNAPFDLDDYVFRAVFAAYDIAAGGEAIEAQMMERFGKTVGFGVGVNCGPAVVGNIGCDVRMDYTAIGDTVNTAARLEANAKKGQILISEHVYERIKDRVEVTPIGEIPLKGKSVGIMVYSVNRVEGKPKLIDEEHMIKE